MTMVPGNFINLPLEKDYLLRLQRVKLMRWIDIYIHHASENENSDSQDPEIKWLRHIDRCRKLHDNQNLSLSTFI